MVLYRFGRYFLGIMTSSLIFGTIHIPPPSSSGLGHLVFSQRIAGSNPTGGTRKKVRLNGGFFVSISSGFKPACRSADWFVYK